MYYAVQTPLYSDPCYQQLYNLRPCYLTDKLTISRAEGQHAEVCFMIQVLKRKTRDEKEKTKGKRDI